MSVRVSLVLIVMMSILVSACTKRDTNSSPSRLMTYERMFKEGIKEGVSEDFVKRLSKKMAKGGMDGIAAFVAEEGAYYMISIFLSSPVTASASVIDASKSTITYSDDGFVFSVKSDCTVQTHLQQAGYWRWSNNGWLVILPEGVVGYSYDSRPKFSAQVMSACQAKA